MNTLKNIYEEISKDPKKWLYYDKQNNQVSNDIILSKFYDSACQANEFIHKYFEAGEKAVFDIKNIKYFGYESKRDIHTISAFLLGIIIADKINLTFSKTKLFIWFLTCLYHDIGYAIENDMNLIRQALTLEKFMKLVDIKNENNLFIVYKKKTLCKNYYRYIKDKFAHIDHGITGGLLLYNKLVKNYYTIKENNNFGDEFVYKNLRFSKELFKDYEKAAISIIRHNMWFATEKQDIEIYKAYHLEKLIATDENKIKKCDNTILFLLCLADTIEPIKQFSNIKPEYILDNICLEIKNNKIIIKNLCEHFECKKYFEKIKSLEKWMNVNVNENTSENCIGIEIIELSPYNLTH